jgi:hypothetical protein
MGGRLMSSQTNLVIWGVSLFALILCILMFFQVFLNYLEEHNIKSCNFVCDHLSFVKDIYYHVYPELERRFGFKAGFDYYKVKGRAKLPIPISEATNEPIYCPCEIETYNYTSGSIQRWVFTVNYTDWLNWWNVGE